MSPRRAPALPLALALAILAAAPAVPVAGAAPGLAFADDFESGAPGWSATGLWHLSAVTGSTSFWYGDEATFTYETGEEPNGGTLLSPPIDLTGNAGESILLTFFETAAHEESCSFERPIVEISVDGGAFTTLSDRCVVGGSTGTVSIPLTGFGGSVVQLAFVWETLDGEFNDHFGWSVDDVTVEVLPSPELSWAGSTANPSGGGVFLTTSVANTGFDAAGVVVEYFVHTAEGALVFQGSSSTDVPGGATITLDLGEISLQTGDYVLTTHADAVHAYAEANEEDNVGTLAFRHERTPDLTPLLAVFMDGAQTFIDTATQNDGSEASLFVVRYETFDMGGALLDQGSVAVEGLAEGATFFHTFGPLAYPPGEYHVVFTVDADGQVAEGDETNNVADLFHFVPEQLPDLQVGHDHFDVLPSGATFEMQVFSANGGSVAAQQVEVLVQVFDDQGTLVAADGDVFGELCAGCTETTTYSFALPDGHYFVVSAIDPQGFVTESDEGNNFAQDEVFIGGTGLPNLAVTQFFHAPDPAFEGDFVTLVAVVENQGTGVADASELGLFLTWPDGTQEQFAQATVSPLPPGASEVLEFPIGNVPAGSYDLRAVADLHQQVTESSEADNEAQHTLVVFTGGDLPNLVAAASVDPAQEGEATTLRAFVSNFGFDAGAFRVEMWLDGVLVDSVTLPFLASGASEEIVLPWTATPGAHQLDVVVDADGEVPETDEADNFASFAFFVEDVVEPAPADLAVTILGVDRAPVRTDLGDLRPNPVGRRTVEVSACNLGSEPILGGTLDVTLESAAPKDAYESTITLGSFELPRLDGGECATFHARWDAAGSVGDVDIVARGFSPDEVEGDATNDDDLYEDYVLVGGFGGVALL